MSIPTPDQMQQFMNALGAQGIIVITFDQKQFHTTSIAKSTGMADELVIVADGLGQQVWSMLEGQRLAQIRKKYKFNPDLDPNFRG